jgi:uncharacterized damage-inducible protein DinB
MLRDSLLSLFERDLNRLKEEINLFIYEEDLWLTPGSIKNSPGNLCLHICGNLKHFIGAVLGDTKYMRQREQEFSSKNVPKNDLLENIEETKSIVLKTISDLDDNTLSNSYPINVFDDEMSTDYFLIHLSSHLNYHLGQINYLRRFLID